MGTRDHMEPQRSLPPDIAAAIEQEATSDRGALERVWHVAGEPLRREPSDQDFALLGDQVWAALEREMRQSPRPPRAPASRRRTRAWRWPVALTVVLAIGLAGLFYLTAESTYTAAPGERLTLTLPDGSIVELNSGATLTYAPRTFGWRSRITALEGEAYFEVIPDASEFITQTYNAEIRVLGTAFNVRAWPGEHDGGTVVSLQKGRVALSSRMERDRAVILRPGQMSRVDEQTARPTLPQETDLTQATAWRTGRFVFVDEPLSVILAEMERRFGVRIEATSKEILDDRLSLAYDDPTGADIILEDIASSYSRYQFRRISGGYELYAP